MKKMLGLFLVVLVAGFTAAQTDSVTFNVDMGVQVFNHQFDPATDVLTVSGNFNGWNTTADTLTDGDLDTVYTITIDTFAVNDTLWFQFLHSQLTIANKELHLSRKRSKKNRVIFRPVSLDC